MFPEERRNKIMTMLLENKRISVKALCEATQASEATIRRDLSYLEQHQKLERTHGGAVVLENISLTQEDSFSQKSLKLHEEKRRIAATAFHMLEENESLVLDAGTTTLELAKLIGDSNKHLVVVTNSTTVSQTIARNPNVELYAIGGRVRLNTLAAVGNMAMEALERFNVRKAFIGVNGVTIDNGLTTPDLEEARVKYQMMKIASEVTILADHSKFKKVALCEIAPIGRIDRIITDTQLKETIVSQYSQYDIEVICV